MKKNLLFNIAIGLIILLFLILLFAINKKNTAYQQHIKDIEFQNSILKKENELLVIQLHLNSEFRKKVYKDRDSINNVIFQLKNRVKTRDKELSQIKGKYENLSLDSLLKIATERYEKDNNIIRINTN